MTRPVPPTGRANGLHEDLLRDLRAVIPATPPSSQQARPGSAPGTGRRDRGALPELVVRLRPGRWAPIPRWSRGDATRPWTVSWGPVELAFVRPGR